MIKAPQPRVGDIAILVVMMRRGIASRAVHGGNPRHSAVLSGRKSSVYRRETSSGFDMEREWREKEEGKARTCPGSVSEVGVAVLALVKCECDESPGAKKKKNGTGGMGIREGKKLEAEDKPPSPVKAGAVI